MTPIPRRGLAPCFTLLMAALWMLPVTSSWAASEWVYVLSWSPYYCSKKVNAREPQCLSPRHFLPRGLSPEAAVAKKPCGATKDLDPSQVDRLLPIVENRKEIRNRWLMEGGCVDLPFDEFVVKFDYASRRLRVPEEYLELEKRVSVTADELREQFARANPGLAGTAMALRCDSGELSEVALCIDGDARFRDCVAAKDTGCRSRISIPGSR